MLADKLVMLLVNVPVDAPSSVFVVRSTVGFAFTLQHTPFAVTSDPPSEVTSALHDAELNVTFDTVPLVTIGVVMLLVVNPSWFP